MPPSNRPRAARKDGTPAAATRGVPPPAGPHELRDYALIADGLRGAVVGPAGELTWMCFPEWDGAAVFADLIGGQGRYAVTPQGRYVWGGFYEEGSLIWRSRWVTPDGIVECREALAMPPAADRAVVLRRILGVDGAGRLSVVVQPRDGYGKAPLRRLRQVDDGSWVGRAGDVWIRWSGPEVIDRPDGHGGRLLLGEVAFRPGFSQDLVLELWSREPDAPPPSPGELWHSTEAAWSGFVPRCDGVPGQRDVRHGYCVLRGLSGPGGGTVAAATASLPERADQGRSYDYRYVWIRDQCYIGRALLAGERAGQSPSGGGTAHRPPGEVGADLIDRTLRFVVERILEDGPDLSPAYTPRGGPIPGERSLDLPGYPGGGDVVGNHVNRQFQLDAVGEALGLLGAAARADRLDADGWRAAEVAARVVAERWQQPEAGIWELDDRHWTQSGMAAVAGLRVAAEAGAPRAAVREWTSLADAITAAIAADSVHPSGRWMRAPDDPRVDCSLLMPVIRGGFSWSDPRCKATLDAVLAELTEDGYCYRYRPDERPLGEAEGAFLLCGFMLGAAHAQLGQVAPALRWFERNRAATGPAGLLSEEFDVTERQQRGNLPQAFTHAMLVETAFLLHEAEVGPDRDTG